MLLFSANNSKNKLEKNKVSSLTLQDLLQFPETTDTYKKHTSINSLQGLNYHIKKMFYLKYYENNDFSTMFKRTLNI